MMVRIEVYTKKVSRITQYLDYLKKQSKISFSEFIKNYDTQSAILYNLEKCLQALIDLLLHVISDEGWAVDGSHSEIYTTLSKNKVLPNESAENFRKMMGLRNRLVHEYGEIDLKIIHRIIANNLNDIQKIIKETTDYLKL
jgi:uncharacterized protein YutE (UPF0331/DUF86 family)